MRKRVTFSRNVTLSLSRTCRCYCKYCAFATHQPHLHEPDEVLRLIDRAARRQVKELLVLTGEAPDHHPGVRAKLAELGFADFVDYVVWACGEALDRGLLPHTNLGVMEASDLARLRAVTASQGLMLESVNPDLVAHQGSPTKHPAERLATIRAAGELRIPFTSGILVGIGESEDEQVAALEALAGFDHIQEVILQNFVPHQSYYGQEPADIADAAASQLWRTGIADRPSEALPKWANPISLDDLVRLIGEARRLLPGVGIQVPPNLSEWWPELVAAGATDLGGLSANGDHISPEHPFPSPRQVRDRLQEDGVALAERLCVYPQFMSGEWQSDRVLEVIDRVYPTFKPRRAVPTLNGSLAGVVARAHAGEALTPDELTGLFAENRPGAVEDIRQAADSLRAELAGDEVTFVVNRNVNVSNVCVVGCAFCGFGVGKNNPDAYEHDREEFVRRLRDAIDYGATEVCIQSGIHPDWSFDDYLGWLRLARETAPSLHLHAYSPMEVDHMATTSGLSPHAVFERLREAGLGSVPGTAAEVLEDGVRQRISPNKLPAARWVEIVSAAHDIGLRSTVTVMFGHIEQPHELAEHMRVVRALQERTGGFTEFVPLSFIPYQTQLGRRYGIEPISREDNLRHTAVFRLALGAVGAQPAGELGEDGPRRRDGVPALGRQRPRRDADGGVDLPHGRQRVRCAAGPGAARRRGPRGRPARGGADDPVRGAPEVSGLTTVAVLPVKSFGRAKTRTGLVDPARGELAERMALRVLSALGEVRSLERVIVVTREPRIASVAPHVVDDPDEVSHSAAARLGVDAAVAAGARRVLLVPGDCPLLDPDEVDALLDFAPRGVTVVPDRHGTGTNALVLDPPDALAPSFGPGSCARHAALARAAGVRVAIRHVPSLAFDVDTPDDVAALRLPA